MRPVRFRRTSQLACFLLLGAACSESRGGLPSDAGSSAAGDGEMGSGAVRDDGGTPVGSLADGGEGTPRGARIALQLTTPSTVARSVFRAELVAGAAWGAGLRSLSYLIRDIALCESLDVAGSGYQNPQGCISLYDGPKGGLAYDPQGDLTALGDEARALSDGYVDLLDPEARARLARSTALTAQHVHDYNYGIITWALPIKVRAEVTLADGRTLYTHDGVSRSELVGADHYRNYYTAPSTPLDQGPAEQAVVLLPNGGNWFKLQTPLRITAEDLAQERAIALDLVFDPDGLVKGYAGDRSSGALREDSDAGTPLRAISLPMLDLAPVPHYADQRVVRSVYRGPLTLGSEAFDVRIELYGLEADPTRAVYGVDTKTLVNADTRSVPPDFSKVSYVVREADGSLSLFSWKRSLIAHFAEAAAPGDTSQASVVCGTHQDRAAAEGGAALVVESCPSENLTFPLTLVSRSTLGGSPVAAELDGGTGDGGTAESSEAAVADASADDAG